MIIRTYIKRPQLKPAAEVIESQFESIGLKTSVIILESGAIETDMDKDKGTIILLSMLGE